MTNMVYIFKGTVLSFENVHTSDICNDKYTQPQTFKAKKLGNPN